MDRHHKRMREALSLELAEHGVDTEVLAEILARVVKPQDKKKTESCTEEFCVRPKTKHSEFCTQHNPPKKDDYKLQCRNIGGIYYYLGENGKVYKTEDVLAGRSNPKVVGEWITVNGAPALT
jgi:hypothetical protein